MAGVCNSAFRLTVKEFGAGLVCAEMVSDKAILYKNARTMGMLYIDEREKPLSLQIFGGEKETLVEAAKFVDKNTTADIIDINMGCPAPKISSNGSGSALMKNPRLCGEIVKAVTAVTDIPVTVKIRKGWDDDSVNAVEVATICESAGAAAITVHGRRQIEFYSGVADHSYAREVKKAVQIPVIVNGDINSKESYKKALTESGADGAMVARAAVGRPFIFSEILDLPFEKNVKNDVLTQIEIAKNFYPQNVLVGVMKKHLCAYAKTAELPKKTNLVFTSLTDFDDMIKAINEYFV